MKNKKSVLKYFFISLLFITFSFSIFGQTAQEIGYAEEEFRRGVQAFYRGSFNDSILQFEKALSYLPEEGPDGVFTCAKKHQQVTAAYQQNNCQNSRNCNL